MSGKVAVLRRCGHGHLGDLCAKTGNFGETVQQLPERLQFGTTAFQQGSSLVSLTAMVSSVKVLAIPDVKLRLDAVINLMKCFPSLEKLYIKTGHGGKKNAWHLKSNRNLIGTLGIRLKKIVFADYLGNKSHVNFAKFFISNARVLESVTLELLEDGNISSAWVETQYRLLQIGKRARAQFDFVSRNMFIRSLSHCGERKQVHDLSTADPFI
ncbi:hypothetical protein C2845_PM04G00030 [Panicum miliaceum]|uniref:Uncharacterized protein n=1 Tax=Panicum miliaceum TaxID=4540 RepID=A0A3L6QN24_PANMI|nr:hypothetical protein C2845_PM04G00030 [Panicum miliaceum]